MSFCFPLRGIAVAAVFVLSVVHPAFAESPRRLPSVITDVSRLSVAGTVSPIISAAQDGGELTGDTVLPRLALRFRMTEAQQADLDQLLREQVTPGNENYHRFLSPAEFGQRFGANPEDLASAERWLESQGFSGVSTAANRLKITFSATASQVESAFQVHLHQMRWNGETHFANIDDPQLPQALQAVVENVRGLHDLRKKAHTSVRLHPHWTSNLTGSHFLAPGDIATIYNLSPLYGSGLDGSGVTIAVAGQSNIQISDVRAFRAAAGLAALDPQVTVVGTDPGLVTSGDESEADLDVQWAGALGRNASVVLVTAQNVDDAIDYVIDNNVAPILSVSYGVCERQLSRADSAAELSRFAQASAQGITVFASAGDDGASDCDTNAPARQGFSVDEPASLPTVTGIGGTTLTEGTGSYWASTNNASGGGSALSYIPETVWNDSAAATSGSLSATGGGASIYNAKPTWQTGTGVPSDGARDVPDLAVTASPSHDPYLICSGGDCVNGFRNTDTTVDVVGGTSVGPPVYAGIFSLFVQRFGRQGNINPTLYGLAASHNNIFHDVTSGNNNVICRAGSPNCTSGSYGYSAGTGYDQVTGLGSIDAAQLFNNWQGTYAPLASSGTPLTFVPITPCRIADTREANGQFGGPAFGAGETREMDLPSGTCSIPSNAAAYSVNVTVLPVAALNYLTVWPAGQPRPYVSTLNSDGRVKANAAIVPAGVNGGIQVYTTDVTQVVIDISGYFVPSSATTGLQFFPLSPCRVVDTRLATGPLGGPFLGANQSRSFPVQSSPCGAPSTAQAYAMNVTVVPHAPLLYLTTWPTGQTQPGTSTLNDLNATATANGAVIPAGAGGEISAFATADTDVIFDINGYFAPPAAGGNYLYTVSPCRVSDTRNSGAGPAAGNNTVNLTTSGCQAPSSAQAYVLNATVVPSGILRYLTIWPSNVAQPFVSTLNADPTTVTSNLAIVGSGGGSLTTFATEPTYVILDLFGYFAP